MTEQNKLNNDDNNQSLSDPQKSEYHHLFISEQHTQNEYNIENNIPFSNEQLNDQFLSGKRKKFQIIFSIILYILGTILLFFGICILIDKKFKLKKFLEISPLLIISISDIILPSINVYYTKKYQNSRNTYAYIISGINLFIVLFTLFDLTELVSVINSDNYIYFIAEIIFTITAFINIIFSILLFFFNSKSKCCKCFN